jgi:hypothetical protein
MLSFVNPPRLILEIDATMSAVVAYHKARLQFVDRPGRREAESSRVPLVTERSRGLPYLSRTRWINGTGCHE